MDEKKKAILKLEKKRSLNISNVPVNITTGISWIVILSILILLVGVVYWGFFGSIDVTLKANGVLVSSGGFTYVYSSGEGMVYDIAVEIGDRIKKGDIIARLDKTELVNRIVALEKELEVLSREERKTRQDELESLKAHLQQEMSIVASEEGIVSEKMVQKGQFVEKGQEIVKINRTGYSVKELVAALYYKIEDGKKIYPGMSCRIVPSTVSKDAYGFLLGTVVSVSEYPSTAKEIAAFTGSDEFGEMFAKDIVIEVIVDLIPSKDTVSGYQWTSKEGPPMKIENGTICEGITITGSVKPIQLILK